VDSHTRVGVTLEGLPCTVTLYYEPGATAGVPPQRITGMYQSGDGPGAFEIVRDGQRYRDADTGEAHEQAHMLMPWVVVEGDW